MRLPTRRLAWIVLLMLCAVLYFLIRSVTYNAKHHTSDIQFQENVEWQERDLWNPFPLEADAPSFCLAEPEAKVCENSSLPELIFVVGVSGSGHHLIKALVSKIHAYEIADFLPFLHIYEPGRDNNWSNLHYAIVEKHLLRKRLWYMVDLLGRARSKGKRGVVLVANSFPMGKDAGMQATGRPDLIDLKKFIATYIDLNLW